MTLNWVPRNFRISKKDNSSLYRIPNPADTTLNQVPRNFRISKKDNSSLYRIPNPAESKSLGIPEFYKILNGFAGIPIKIHKILGKFMEFQSSSPSIYYRISNVVHGGGVCGYFLKYPTHYTAFSVTVCKAIFTYLDPGENGENMLLYHNQNAKVYH